MDKITELLLKENKILGEISRVYARLDNLLKTEGALNQVLYAIYMEEKATQKIISVNYCIPLQTVNNTVHSLIKKGYIQLIENEKDRRQKIIAFTKEGKEFAKENVEKVIAIEKAAIEKLGMENYSKMIEIEDKYRLALNEEIEKRFSK
ncbi:MAG: winged helix DNA-binding protein [Treponema sp.]|nr:winged helix DNA-binding protein [Treponema sp.]